LFGREFLLQTDNSALTRTFNPEKEIPQIAAPRIQRWSIVLSAFRYKIKHIKGSDNYADWLSRMPLKTDKTTGKDRAFLEEIPNVYINSIKAYDFATLDWKNVQRATREDALLCKVMRWCLDGWPDG